MSNKIKTFADYLSNLNAKTYKLVKTELRMTLGISDATFTKWKNGEHSPSPVYHNEINTITLKHSNLKFF